MRRRLSPDGLLVENLAHFFGYLPRPSNRSTSDLVPPVAYRQTARQAVLRSPIVGITGEADDQRAAICSRITVSGGCDLICTRSQSWFATQRPWLCGRQSPRTCRSASGSSSSRRSLISHTTPSVSLHSRTTPSPPP